MTESSGRPKNPARAARGSLYGPVTPLQRCRATPALAFGRAIDLASPSGHGAAVGLCSGSVHPNKVSTTV